ncbi:MAG: carbamoylphosphate synthase large subunit [Lachnospiraceae bacterium]|jgi:hypothetical protein
MNFIFISPNYPDIYRYFCMRLKDNSVNVLGIGDADYDNLHPDLRYALTEYYKVQSLKNYDEMVRAVGYFTYRYGRIDWLESNNEYWLEQDSWLRTDFNINTGLKSWEMARFKYKSVMKEYFQRAGLKTAAFELTDDLDHGIAFARRVGYPVIVKPDNGVGANDTWRIENDYEMSAFFRDHKGERYIMEEYVTGDVTTYDGVCNSKGEVMFAASHITSTPIMDIVNEGMACTYYVDKYVPADVEHAGRAVLKAFGAKSRAFHLEFFRLTKAKEGLGEVGDLVPLEVNMRPAGGFTTEMINFANSVDEYQIYADMVAFDENRHTYGTDRYYCVYCGRRDNVRYIHSDQDLQNRYGSAIREHRRMEGVMSSAMGNDGYIACFDTQDEIEAFRDYVFATPEEEAKKAAEAARETAEAAKKPAEAAKETAEAAREPAEVARETAEAAEKPAENAKETAEAAKKPAEAVKKPAETAKKPTEAAKKAAEPVKEPAGAEKKPAGKTPAAAPKAAASSSARALPSPAERPFTGPLPKPHETPVRHPEKKDGAIRR